MDARGQKPRHTLGSATDAASLIELLVGKSTGEEATSEFTVDGATFQEFFGTGGGDDETTSSSSRRRSRRRETADPSKLRELLEQCMIEANEGDEGEDGVVDQQDAARRQRQRQQRGARELRRRISCDPRLLKQLVLDPAAAPSAAPSAALQAVSEGSPEHCAADRALEEEEHARHAREAAAAAAASCARDSERAAHPPIAACGEDAEEDSNGVDRGMEDEDEFDSMPHPGRASMAWTFDETRATMHELRRQLRVERDVATDAERERDDLAKEVAAMRDELTARADLVAALETQRDAACKRAASAEHRAARADEDLARANTARAAAEACAETSLVRARRETSEKDAALEQARTRTDAALETDRSRADATLREVERRALKAEAEASVLRTKYAATKERVVELERVKITKDFAAKVRAVVQERDELAAKLATLVAGKENNTALLTTNNAAPPPTALALDPREHLTQANASDECRQS